jgi:PAS domain S-box-containing protein
MVSPPSPWLAVLPVAIERLAAVNDRSALDRVIEELRGLLPGASIELGVAGAIVRGAPERDTRPLATLVDAAVARVDAAFRVAEDLGRGLEDSPAIIAVRRGPDHVLTFANRRYREMVGEERSILGRPGREALPEVAAQGFFDHLDRVFHTGVPHVGHEARAVWDRGAGRTEEGWYDYVWQALRDAQGAIVGTMLHALDVTDLVMARRAVEAERAVLHSLLMRAPVVVTMTRGPDHRLEFANDAYRRTVGPRDDLGKPLRDAFPELVEQGWLELWDQVYTTGESVSATEAPVLLDRQRDGTLAESWFNVSIEARRDASGEVFGIISHAVDVTDQVRQRRQVEADRASLQDMLMQAPALIAITRGPEHRFHLVNPQYEAAVGRRDLLGQAFAEALPELAEQGYLALLDQVYRSGRAFATHEATAWMLRDGIRVEGCANLVYQPLRDADGRVNGIMTHAVDVTSSVAARREVEAARARYRELVQSLDAIVWESSPDGQDILFVSDRAEALLGWPLAAWGEPRFLAKILLDEDRPRLRARQQAEVDGSAEFRVRAADGRVVWLHDTVRVVRDAAGAIQSRRGVMVDVSARREAEAERERMQDQLIHTQKLESLGVLAGGIAHDFNNLLTVILGNASLASLRLTENSPARGPIDDLVVTAQRAADLVRQLLAYSGRAHVKAEVLDLNAQVREIVGLLEATLPRKVEIRLDCAPGAQTIEADPAQVQQVAMNLVLNAAEAIGELRGTVRVSTGVRMLTAAELAEAVGAPTLPAGAYATLTVEDDGAGMDAATLSRVFDPFFSTKAQGRGLGLAVVLGVVRTHHGGLRLQSAPGRGTRIEVYFPVSSRSPARVAPPSAPAVRGGLNVLIVDDEVDVRGVARAMLEHLGYGVVEAGDGQEAMAVLAERKDIAVLLLDVTMPVMDGEEVLRAMRRERRDIPVILSSGFSELDSGAQGIGAAGFLQKPYTVRQLASALAQVVGG